jgi:hypothetical protein
MSTKFWRRLAGCIAISSLTAAAPEYRAGAAAVDHVRAVAIESRQGGRAVFAEADFPITRAISDFVAVQLLKTYDLERASITISGTGSAAADTAAILTAIQQAISRLEPAAITSSGVLSVRAATGACVATLYPVRLSGCRDGDAVRGPIRAAFQMIDLPHPLQTRDAAAPAYPVQAVAIGKTTILALGGEVPPGRFRGIVVPHANDTTPMPDEPHVRAAIASVLKRVR